MKKYICMYKNCLNHSLGRYNFYYVKTRILNLITDQLSRTRCYSNYKSCWIFDAQKKFSAFSMHLNVGHHQRSGMQKLS